ncbi:MAG: FKBP-type peptidyl-prolyl cis-trans isomerase [Blastochloris sp.]|nr:FKBP-type peptidyl-prolyl cis-trans isomerase [Blastochloris sp.]
MSRTTTLIPTLDDVQKHLQILPRRFAFIVPLFRVLFQKLKLEPAPKRIHPHLITRAILPLHLELNLPSHKPSLYGICLEKKLEPPPFSNEILSRPPASLSLHTLFIPLCPAQEALQNITEEFNFLRENKERETVKTTPSGLQYEVLQSGTGKTPLKTSTVVVHYTGKTLSGRTFDSSYDRFKPSTFGVTRVIRGWTEALLMMKEGDKWKLYIPSKLAYGAAGSPPSIGPNQMLIFDIELLEVK